MAQDYSNKMSGSTSGVEGRGREEAEIHFQFSVKKKIKKCADRTGVVQKILLRVCRA